MATKTRIRGADYCGSQIMIVNDYALNNEVFMHGYRAAQLDGRPIEVTKQMVDAVACDAAAVTALREQIRQHCAIIDSKVAQSIKNGQTPVFVILDCSAVPFISTPMVVQKSVSNFRKRIARDPKVDYYILNTDISQRELKHKYGMLRKARSPSFADGKYQQDFSCENIDFYRYSLLNALRAGAIKNAHVLDVSLSISHMVMLPIEKRVMTAYEGDLLKWGNIGLRNEMNDDFQLELLLFLRDELCRGSDTLMLTNDYKLAKKCQGQGVPCVKADKRGMVHNWNKLQ